MFFVFLSGYFVIKKLRLIIFLIIISSFAANAQKFDAYLFAGIAASQVSGDELGGFDKAGITGGAGVFTPLSKKLLLGFEINYVQKGSRKPSKLSDGDPEQYLLRLNYAEVPLTLQYAINEQFSAYAGMALGILVGSTEENENGEIPFREPFEKFDASMLGGLKYKLNEHFYLDLRGIQSVVPVRQFSGNNNYYFDNGQYNSVIIFSFSYVFDQKKKDE